MTLPRPIIPDQTDAKSPVDDNLMDSIREDLDYLDEQQTTSNPSFRFTVNGSLAKSGEGVLVKKALANDVSTDSAEIPLGGVSFSSLVIGARYRLFAQIRFMVDTGAAIELLAINSEPVSLMRESNETSDSTRHVSIEFNATSPNLSLFLIGVGGAVKLFGNLLEETETFFELRRIDIPLSLIDGAKKRVDCGILTEASRFNSCKISLEQSGLAGALEVDIRKHSYLGIPISGIVAQFSDDVLSVDRLAPSLATQSVTAATPDISTQSISYHKSPLDILSIIPIPITDNPAEIINYAQVNLDGVVDNDWMPQDGYPKTVKLDSTSGGLLDGEFEIVEINRGGGSNIVIKGGGLFQSSAAGTAQLGLYSYNFTNPVDSDFFPGEFVHFSGHDETVNNLDGKIYKINEGGNNILVFRFNGLEQAGAAGTASCARKSFNLLSNADEGDFVVGEYAFTSGHTSSSNDGNFLIVDVNRGGSNLILYSLSLVNQGGVAGSIDTNRFIYSLNNDPSSDVSIGDRVNFLINSGFTANTGFFEVLEVNRLASNNLVVYNEGGFDGEIPSSMVVVTERKLVKFSSDQSSLIDTDSIIEIEGHPFSEYVHPAKFNVFDIQLINGHQVYEVNRGGGANYNAVIKTRAYGRSRSNNGEYDFPVGRVAVESKSIFETLPSLNASAFIGGNYTDGVNYNGSDIGPLPRKCLSLIHTDFKDEVVPADTPLYLWINSTHSGDPRDLSVVLL